MKILILATLIVSALLTAPAFAGQKVLLPATIQQLRPVVAVLMPCNWMHWEPVIMTATYEGTDDRKMLEKSKTTVMGRYLMVEISPEEEPNLKAVFIDFPQNRRRCPDGSGVAGFGG